MYTLASRFETGTGTNPEELPGAAHAGCFEGHIVPRANVVPATPVPSRLRMLEDVAEVGCIREAARAADAGMTVAGGALRVGMRETDVAGEAEYAMRRAGAEGLVSATYVASGPRSAMAHGSPSPEVIEDGDVVQVHVAPIARGYTVDLCRTLFVGKGAAEAAEALGACVEAQEAGIAAATPGASLMGIDEAMSMSLRRSRYADAFLRPVFPWCRYGTRRGADPLRSRGHSRRGEG